MIRDTEWKLTEAERQSIRGALYYFVDPDDLIPDHMPGIGFLDDAMYAEIIVQELKTEIKMYQEFCQFRISEENRQRNKGIDPMSDAKTGSLTSVQCSTRACVSVAP